MDPHIGDLRATLLVRQTPKMNNRIIESNFDCAAIYSEVHTGVNVGWVCSCSAVKVLTGAGHVTPFTVKQV